jgi:hypothetical protein
MTEEVGAVGYPLCVVGTPPTRIPPERTRTDNQLPKGPVHRSACCISGGPSAFLDEQRLGKDGNATGNAYIHGLLSSSDIRNTALKFLIHAVKA